MQKLLECLAREFEVVHAFFELFLRVTEIVTDIFDSCAVSVGELFCRDYSLIRVVDRY